MLSSKLLSRNVLGCSVSWSHVFVAGDAVALRFSMAFPVAKRFPNSNHFDDASEPQTASDKLRMDSAELRSRVMLPQSRSRH